MLKQYFINKKNNLYYLTKNDIENETEDILNTYFPECLEKPSIIPIEMLISEFGINFDIKNLSKDNSCYGAFVFNKGIINTFDDSGEEVTEIYEAKTIILDKKIYSLQNGMTFFTMAHELGHYYLQYILKHVDENQCSIFEMMEPAERAEFFSDTAKELDANLNDKDEIYRFSFLEWQPNYFASCILMPKKMIDMKLREIVPGFKKLQFYSTLKNLNKNDYDKVINVLKETFNVSKTALENRLNSLEYI